MEIFYSAREIVDNLPVYKNISDIAIERHMNLIHLIEKLDTKTNYKLNDYFNDITNKSKKNVIRFIKTVIISNDYAISIMEQLVKSFECAIKS